MLLLGVSATFNERLRAGANLKICTRYSQVFGWSEMQYRFLA